MPRETCGPIRDCAWRRATLRSLRGNPTNPSRYCIALTQSGDPCGRIADHYAAPRYTQDDPDPLIRYVGQPFCAVHYHQLHQHFLGPSPQPREPEVEPDQPEEIDLGYVYFARRGDEVKIGFSKQPDKRLTTIENQGGFTLDEVVMYEAPPKLERHYHKRFSDSRTIGEWFTMTPDIRAVMSELADLS